MRNFILVKKRIWKDPTWLEDWDEKYYKNRVGGITPKENTDKIIKIEKVEDFDDLDWTLTDLHSPEPTEVNDCGWISPTGKCYFCNYMHHDAVAYYVIKKRYQSLLDGGWVKVNGYNSPYYCSRELTQQQIDCLAGYGYKLENNEYDTKDF